MRKFVIRRSAFETNSSSAHTVVLTSQNEWVSQEDIRQDIDDLLIKRNDLKKRFDLAFRREDGSIYLPLGYYISVDENGIPSMAPCTFGHEFSVLTNWYEKLGYIVASFKYDLEKVIAIKDVVHDYYPEITGFAFVTSEQVNALSPNAKVFTELSDYEVYSSFGEVDHQSNDNIEQAINAIRDFDKYKDKSFEDIIREMIFCNKFAIITDSDSCDTFEDIDTSSVCQALGVDRILEFAGYKNPEDYNSAIYRFIDFNTEARKEHDSWYNK